MIVLRGLVGLLLVAHGLVHLLYLAKDAPEFSTETSWLVPKAWRRPVAGTLTGATVVGFALLGWELGRARTTGRLAGRGDHGQWRIGAADGRLLPPRLLLGLAIDAALVAVALTQPGWSETLVGGG